MHNAICQSYELINDSTLAKDSKDIFSCVTSSSLYFRWLKMLHNFDEILIKLSIFTIFRNISILSDVNLKLLEINAFAYKVTKQTNY